MVFQHSRPWHFLRGLAARQRRDAACRTFRAARGGSAALLACVALAACLMVVPAHAQTSWNYTGGGAGTWGTASSWTGGSVPTASTTVYLSSTNVTGDVDIVATAGILASGMVFQNTGATVIRSSSATVRTGTIGAGGITMNSGVGNVWFGSTTSGSTITLSITANQTWLNNSTSGSLTQRGDITTTSGSVTLTIDGPGNTSVLGAITGTTTGNRITIVKNGSGLFRLDGTNTFTGGLTLNSGSLMLGANAALGTGTFTTGSNGVSIDVTAARTLTNNNAQVWNGDFTFLGTNTLNTGTGGVTLGGNRIITTNASVLTVGGVINDDVNTYSLTKAGNGVLQLNAANTFDGGVMLQTGTLRIGNNSAVGTGTITFGGGALSGTGTTLRTLTNAVTFTGDGTIGEAATNTAPLTFNGGVDLGGSTRTLTVLSSTATFAGAVSGAGGLTKGGTGTLVLSTSNSYGGPTTVSAGNLTVSNASALGSGAAALNANGGTLSIGSGLNIVRTGPITVAGGTISSGTLTNNGGSALDGQSGQISSVLAGSAGLTKSGTGLLVLTATNRFAGPVVINSGTLRVTSQINNGGVNGGLGSASNDPANLTINGGVLQFSSGTTTSTDRGITIGPNGGGIANASTVSGAAFDLTGPLVLSGSGDRTISLFTSNVSGGNGSLSSNISDPSGGGKTSVVVTGTATTSGRWMLSGTSNFTGGLTVGTDASRIGIASLRSTGDFSNLAGGVTINPGSTLELETGTLTTTVANSGVIKFGPLNNNTADFTLSGIVSGTGSMFVTHNTTNRTLRLTGTANTYTGPTTITAQTAGVGQSTLVVTKLADYGQNSSIGAYASTGNPTTDAANLRFGDTSSTGTGATANLTYTGSGDSTNRLFLVQTSATAAGPNTSGGVSLLNNGSGNLDFTSTDAIPFANGTNGYGIRLTLGGAWTGTNSFAPAWSDNGTDISSRASSLAVSGSGAWIVSNTNNTYSGGSSISGGQATLVYGGLNVLGSGSVTFTAAGSLRAGVAGTFANNLVMTSSGTLNNGGFAQTLIGVISGAGGVSIAGSGTTTLTGSNTYSGATSIAAGNRLVVGGAGVLGSSGTYAAGVSNAGSFEFASSADQTLSGTISGAGSMIKSGDGLLTLTSTNNSFTGGSTLSAGRTRIGSNLALGTGTVTFTGGSLSANSATARTLAAPVAFNTASVTLGDTVDTGALTLSGTMDLGGSSRELNVLSGVTISGTVAGAGGLTKTGNGRLQLSATNTFGGPVSINSGTLAVLFPASLGNSDANDPANLKIAGGVLEIRSGTTFALARAITFGTAGGGLYSNPSVSSVSSPITLSGSVAYEGTGNRTITLLTPNNANGSATWSANIGDPSGGATKVVVLNETGNGTIRSSWILSGSNTFTGGLDVGNGVGATWVSLLNPGSQAGIGTITVNTNAAFSIGSGTLSNNIVNNGFIQSGNAGVPQTFSGDISGSGSFTYNGLGNSSQERTVGLVGLNNSYTGPTVMNQAGGSQLLNLEVMKLANGGENSSIGASSNNAANLEFGALTSNFRYLGTGDSTDRLFSITTNQNSNILFTLDNRGSGALNFTNPGQIVLPVTSNTFTSITLTGSFTGINSFAPAIPDSQGAQQGTRLTIAGNGGWIVSGTNSHSGGTTLSGTGTLILGNRLALGSGTLTITNGASTTGGLASSLDLSGANAVTNAVVLSSNTRITGSNNLELEGVVSSAASRQFAITNTATTTFSAANTYTGTTSVEAGVLVLNNANALPAASNLRIGAGVIGLTAASGDFTRALGTGTDSPRVQITGSNGGFAAIDGNREVNLGGAAATVTWGANSFMTAATGTFRLGAAGAAGMLDFKNPIALAGTGATSRNIFVENGASLIDARLSGILSGSAGFTKLGTGALELTGQNTYTGTTTIAAGTLLVNGTNSGLGQMDVAAGAVLGGTGLINGLVNVTGTLAPGNVGQTGLLGAGALALGNTSLTTIQMTGTNPLLRGGDFDAINVLTGALTYGGDLFFDLSFGSMFEQSTTTTFNIFDFTGSPGGSFASVMGNSSVYGSLNFTNNLGLWTTTTSDPNTTIQFSQLTGDVQFIVVPEPGAVAICGIGIAVAAWRFRRRRA